MNHPFPRFLGLWLTFAAAASAVAQCNTEETAHFFAEGGKPLDKFGSSVATDGVYAVVGAPYENTVKGVNRGAAYIYERNGESWSLHTRLFADDGGRDSFGFSAAIWGDRIVIGAPTDDTWAGVDAGSAYVFRLVDGAWTQEAKLYPSDPHQFADFGCSVSIWNDTVVIGSHAYNQGDNLAVGSAYIFKLQAGKWAEEAQLLASDGKQGERFGHRVAIWDNCVVAGAPQVEFDGLENVGAAYIYMRSDGHWTEAGKLTPSAPKQSDSFGISLAVEDGIIAVGSDRASFGYVEVFVREGESWPLSQYIVANEPMWIDDFGISLAMYQDLLVVGARRRDLPGGDHNGAALCSAAGRRVGRKRP
jgi:hypothetical protein